jgi:hypothetical protein
VHTLKHLSFSGLRKTISARLQSINDTRERKKIEHCLHDVAMSGLAMMFFQDPSLLQFQKRMEEVKQMSNLKSLFNVSSIPKDTCMREVLDEIDPDHIKPAFTDFFSELQRGKYLEQYRVLKDSYIVSVDGSGYFSSHTIHCPGCLRKKGKETLFEHHIVQAALMHPDKRQVIPLCPEEVINTDGQDKQDCEINAGKRLIRKIRKNHPKLSITIVADSLYSKQPFIKDLGREHMHFVLVAKEEDHKVLMEYIQGACVLDEVLSLTVQDPKGRLHRYEWVEAVPLNGNEDAPSVNYLEYSLVVNGKRTYHNAWVTDIPINETNVAELVRIGRCRWKIENEVFNTLKNQGYHIEHSYGHGKNHLSFNFFLLNLLAFFMHQIFELTDKLYQACRQKLGSKKNLWDHFRVAITILIFPDGETLLKRIYTPSDFW